MVELVENVIKNKVINALNPSEIIIENESHQHNVPKNSETHFKLTVVASQFSKKRVVERHQIIYELLKDEFINGLHALALHLFTPEEWLERNGATHSSPQCLGGSKSRNNK